MSTSTSILYSIGGIVTAIIWLAFWLREDSKRPEPRGLILKIFIFGMFSVVLVLPFQLAVRSLVPTLGALSFFLWAIIEEFFKFLAAYYGGFRSKENNEPLDPVIYMITAALGFVALENTMFILNPLLERDILGGVITGNLRFIGTSLLHTAASGAIGISLAISYFKPRKIRYVWGMLGFALAVAIHTIFNLFIMSGNTLSNPIAFVGVWIAVAIMLLFFEKIKTIRTR
jgi:RsiW-degrading membrane proteinase PrsW (M82 family)